VTVLFDYVVYNVLYTDLRAYKNLLYDEFTKHSVFVWVPIFLAVSLHLGYPQYENFILLDIKKFLTKFYNKNVGILIHFNKH
jgi:hypothetical protein